MDDYSARNNQQTRAYIHCPCCNWCWAIERTGGRARRTGSAPTHPLPPFELGKLDPRTARFIRVQTVGGGRGRGFREVERLTMAQAAVRPEYQAHVRQLLRWARDVVALGEELSIPRT